MTDTTQPTKLESYKTAVVSTKHLSPGDKNILTLASHGSYTIFERANGFLIVLPEKIDTLIDMIMEIESLALTTLINDKDTSHQLFHILKTLHASGYKMIDFDPNGATYTQLKQLS